MLDPASLALLVGDARLVVLRGLPGSGKSTLAAKLAQEHGFVHLEADTHFVRDGNYRFDPAHVADAHAWCVSQAFTELKAGKRVVIANTHVKLWELAGPLGLAQLLQMPTRVIECTAQFENIHAVPADVLATMRSKWEQLPSQFVEITYSDGTARGLRVWSVAT